MIYQNVGQSALRFIRIDCRKNWILPSTFHIKYNANEIFLDNIIFQTQTGPCANERMNDGKTQEYDILTWNSGVQCVGRLRRKRRDWLGYLRLLTEASFLVTPTTHAHTYANTCNRKSHFTKQGKGNNRWRNSELSTESEIQILCKWQDDIDEKVSGHIICWILRLEFRSNDQHPRDKGSKCN